MSPQSFSNWDTGKTSSCPWPQRFFTSFSVMYVGIRATEFRTAAVTLLVGEISAGEPESAQERINEIQVVIEL